MRLLEDKQLVTLDWETYYDGDYQLKKLTTEAYIRDPRFEVIGLGIKIGNQAPLWVHPRDVSVVLGTIDWSKAALLCHHTHFDGLILSHHYGIIPALYLDTLSMARATIGVEVGGSLAKVMAHYGVGTKGNEVRNVKGKHLSDFTPEEYTRYGEYCCTDVGGAHDAFWKMVEEGFPESELKLIDTTVRMFTDPIFEADEALLEQFIQDEAARKQALLERVGADKATLMSNDKFAVLLESLGEEPPRKVSVAKSKKTGHEVLTWAFAKTDPGFQALLEHEQDDIRWLAEARLGVKSTINETRAGRFLACARRGPMPVYLKYSGAHTHRWSGGDKMNWQNLQRVDEERPGLGTLRMSVLAPKGHVVVVADSAQIEARVLAWLAGHNELVQAFAQGRDVYSEFATEAYGRTITKADKIERFVGKTCVLGLGFGMGWLKFARTMLQGAMGGPPVKFTQKEVDALKVHVAAFASDPQKMADVEAMPSRLPIAERIIHCAVANEFVMGYRQRSQPITELWREMDARLATMAAGDKVVSRPPIEFGRHCITLPNGLRLRYPGLKRGKNGYTYFGGKAKPHAKIYGGHLVENITQALARIIVAEQMQVISERHHSATMTHDEVVCVVPEIEAQTTLDFMLATMATSPAWAPGLPLKAEGGYAVSYGDAK